MKRNARGAAVPAERAKGDLGGLPVIGRLDVFKDHGGVSVKVHVLNVDCENLQGFNVFDTVVRRVGGQALATGAARVAQVVRALIVAWNGAESAAQEVRVPIAEAEAPVQLFADAVLLVGQLGMPGSPHVLLESAGDRTIVLEVIANGLPDHVLVDRERGAIAVTVCHFIVSAACVAVADSNAFLHEVSQEFL